MSEELRDIQWAVARLGGVSRDALYRWCREGLVPHVRVSSRVLFDPEVLDLWVKSGGTRYVGSDVRTSSAPIDILATQG